MYDQIRSITYRLFGGRTELLGRWERVGDDFAGCVVLVERTPQGLQGRITYVPLTMEPYGWRLGDVKWKDFAARRVLGYRVQDLFKEIDPATGTGQPHRILRVEDAVCRTSRDHRHPAGRDGRSQHTLVSVGEDRLISL